MISFLDGAILDESLGSQRIEPVADILAARACPFFFTMRYGISNLPAPPCGTRRAAKAVWVGLFTVLRAEFGSPIETDAASRGDRQLAAAMRLFQQPACEVGGACQPRFD